MTDHVYRRTKDLVNVASIKANTVQSIVHLAGKYEFIGRLWLFGESMRDTCTAGSGIYLGVELSDEYSKCKNLKEVG